jgi:LSD1 subclass zinc finger protein
MSAWRIGTVVCEGCGAVLNIKSSAERTVCYLCDTPVDLRDVPVADIPDYQPSVEEVQ